MSQWTTSRSAEAARKQHPARSPAQHASAQHSSPDARRSEARKRGASEPAGRTYTIAHAGRQVRVGPVAFWIAVGTVVIMAGWSVTAATYLAFRDDVLRTLIARQAQQQFGYEDRIAELRTQIDRADRDPKCHGAESDLPSGMRDSVDPPGRFVRTALACFAAASVRRRMLR